MGRRVLKKINTELNFWLRQSNYLNYSSRRFKCNALVQPHFDYGCTSWYPLLSNALITKLKISQNKWIRFCLELPPSWSYKPIPFQENKLAAGLTELCTSTTVLKYWEGIAPFCLNDMFIPSLSNYNASSQMALDTPLCRTIKGCHFLEQGCGKS